MTGEFPQDTKYELLRRKMVGEQIQARGVRDRAVLDAMLHVPREEFLPEAIRHQAYGDHPLPIGEGQTMSQPYIVAFMTESLIVAPRHRVLEVGTGSGYQTAILSRLAAHVYSIERRSNLQEEANRSFQRLGLTNLSLFVGDGSLGLPQHAPFDRIIVTAAAPRVPESLVAQLADPGMMVVPVGGQLEQTLVRIERIQQRTIETRLLGCRFVKLVGKEGWFPKDAGLE